MATARSSLRNRTLAAGCGVLTGASLLAVAPMAAAGTTVAQQTYLVVYRTGASTAGAGASVASAGGTLVAAYPQIGVVVARSTNTGFAASMGKTKGVEGASATTGLATRLDGSVADSGTTDPTPLAPVAGGDSLSGLQWDMDQIHAPPGAGHHPGLTRRRRR